MDAIDELFRQHKVHQTKTVILQKYDQRGIKEMIEQHAYETNQWMHVEWIAYPPNLGKVARFETLLQPAFASLKVFLIEGMQWFIDEELLDMPRPRFDDGLDTLSNIIRHAKPAHKTALDEEVNLQKRRIARLKAGHGIENTADFVHILGEFD